ncbi:YceK/YidQ family lipoprotein [Pseudomonas aeruginosa]|nr:MULTISPECIES: YceK/YidQ family lipoprotein [Pseudomonas aeruginosa group]MCR3762808.1 YceK/YidQ family lipoprotein [Pseudomonas aeruginosa]MCT9628058.1 YceK/YidQ family lipoprotein [Pseudomonas aeruginosa]MCW8027591.1 YceK/YidQ family lipoprotein [Pseudomonas aeruginosa]MCW8035353.1 YceK/YidQ family lipoprotein [Pseudomonas aeruginosa]MDY1578493.1 YceK/YidQ family lipoprotein [Pseudomonas paraeruginosa]
MPPTALICKISIVCLSVNMVSLPSDAAVDTLLLPYHALRQHG